MVLRSKVSIVILNWNGKSLLGQLLDEALESALNQTYKNLEVLFVDNGSKDDSVEHVRNRYGDKVRVVLLDRNYGFCLGNNLGVGNTSKDSNYLLFMNPDAVLTRDYVEKLVSIMDSDKTIGVAQGMEMSLDGATSKLGGLIDSLGRGLIIDGATINHEYCYMVLWAFGAAMIVRRGLFFGLKGFSPELFMYCDEADFCIRALCAGYKILGVPRVTYLHKESGVASKMGWLRWYFINRNRWLIVIRYLPREFLFEAFAGLVRWFLINVLRSFRSNERLRVAFSLKALFHVAKNLRRELIIRRRYVVFADNYANYIVKVPPVPLSCSLSKARRVLHNRKICCY